MKRILALLIVCIIFTGYMPYISVQAADNLTDEAFFWSVERRKMVNKSYAQLRLYR